MKTQNHPSQATPVASSFVDLATGEVSDCSILQPETPARRSERLAALGLMSAGIVHDVGNYILAIRAGMTLLERRLGIRAEPEIELLINEILSAADRAGALTRRIVTHVGEARADETIVDLSALVGALSPLIGWAAGSGVEVRIETGTDVPAIRCRPQDLERAILNLVVNARHAMPEGGVLVVEVSRLAPASSCVDSHAVLSVRDSGCGMSSETLRRAFEPFFSAQAREGRSGLGLSIIGDFMRSLGGRTRVESAPGEGTCVMLVFPGQGTGDDLD